MAAEHADTRKFLADTITERVYGRKTGIYWDMQTLFAMAHDRMETSAFRDQSLQLFRAVSQYNEDSIAHIGLTFRFFNALRRGGIHTQQQLLERFEKDSLAELKGMSFQGVTYIREKVLEFEARRHAAEETQSHTFDPE